jgi:four helix bundle protein
MTITPLPQVAGFDAPIGSGFWAPTDSRIDISRFDSETAVNFSVVLRSNICSVIHRLDVYRLSIEYVANAFETSRSLVGLHRHARDQWLRAAQSIPLNIAEGNGKRSLRDRARFLDIARGSALECAAIQDVLVVSGGLNRETSFDLKFKLTRIVAMLTRMAMKCEGVSEHPSEYYREVDYEHEHREAEHEHDKVL